MQVCNGTTQSHRTRGNFIILVPSQGEHAAVPTTLAVAGCKAKSSEGLRLRCACASCPWRPAEPEEGEAEENPDQHISGDDREVATEDLDTFEEEDDEDLEGRGMAQAALASGTTTPPRM